MVTSTTQPVKRPTARHRNRLFRLRLVTSKTVRSRSLRRPAGMSPCPLMADYTGILGPKKPVTVSSSQSGRGATRSRCPLSPAARARAGTGARAGAAGACWLLAAALVVMGLVPAPATGSCQCGLLVMLERTGDRPWTLGEAVMEAGPRPADCRDPATEIDCLNSCANSTIILTGKKNLRMLPLRLSLETQRHVCVTLQPNKSQSPDDNPIVEMTARRLPVGGFYRFCGQDWMHTGVVFPERICCLENKVVDCHDIKKPKSLPFMTVFRKRRQVTKRHNPNHQLVGWL